MTGVQTCALPIFLELKESKHKIVVITGDNQFTAAHVAEELKIVDSGSLVFIQRKDELIEVCDPDGNVLVSSNDFTDIEKILKNNS